MVPTLSTHKQALQLKCAQFYLLYMFYTKAYSTVLLHARDQYIKQSFYTIIVLLDVGPVWSAINE